MSAILAAIRAGEFKGVGGDEVAETIHLMMELASIGMAGQSHNRLRTSVTTTREKVVWSTVQRIMQLEVLVVDTVVTASDANAALKICFDAPDDATATAWLADSDTEGLDVLHEMVQLNEWTPFTFGAPLERADFLAIGTETLRVFIRAVGRID